MSKQSEFKRLLYEHEVLWAKYDIRDHYLNHIVQDIYQNIGQVLSLIRIQLSLLPDTNVITAEPGQLLAKVIQEFKSMCKSFYPEKELLGKSGLVKSFEHELALVNNDTNGSNVAVKGNPVSLPEGTELVTFRMLQEILLLIRKQEKKAPISSKIIYKKTNVNFSIEYMGVPVTCEKSILRQDENLPLARLTILERAELINAQLTVTRSKAGKTTVVLNIPVESPLF